MHIQNNYIDWIVISWSKLTLFKVKIKHRSQVPEKPIHDLREQGGKTMSYFRRIIGQLQGIYYKVTRERAVYPRRSGINSGNSLLFIISVGGLRCPLLTSFQQCPFSLPMGQSIFSVGFYVLTFTREWRWTLTAIYVLIFTREWRWNSTAKFDKRTT